jgi:hypothetical protein
MFQCHVGLLALFVRLANLYGLLLSFRPFENFVFHAESFIEAFANLQEAQWPDFSLLLNMKDYIFKQIEMLRISQSLQK